MKRHILGLEVALYEIQIIVKRVLAAEHELLDARSHPLLLLHHALDRVEHRQLDGLALLRLLIIDRQQSVEQMVLEVASEVRPWIHYK